MGTPDPTPHPVPRAFRCLTYQTKHLFSTPHSTPHAPPAPRKRGRGGKGVEAWLRGGSEEQKAGDLGGDAGQGTVPDLSSRGRQKDHHGAPLHPFWRGGFTGKY